MPPATVLHGVAAQAALLRHGGPAAGWRGSCCSWRERRETVRCPPRSAACRRRSAFSAQLMQEKRARAAGVRCRGTSAGERARRTTPWKRPVDLGSNSLLREHAAGSCAAGCDRTCSAQTLGARLQRRRRPGSSRVTGAAAQQPADIDTRSLAHGGRGTAAGMQTTPVS